MTGTRFLRHVILAAVLLTSGLAMLVVDASPARAHAAFVESQPPPGSSFAQAPGGVVLRFTEPLIMDLSSVEVIGPNSNSVTSGPTEAIEGEPNAMRRGLGLLAPGRYEVRWTTVSPLDGHTLRGSYEFGVATPTRPQQSVEAGPLDSFGPFGLLGKAVVLAALLLWAGGALLWRRLDALGATTGWLGRLLSSAPIGVAVGATAVLLSTAGVQGLPALLSSRSGLLQSGSALAGMAAAGLWHRVGPTSVAARLLAGAAVAAEAGAGHAAATAQPLLAVVVFTVHLAAAGVWVTAIAGAVAARQPLRTALAVLSPAAMKAAGTVAVTGALAGTTVLAGVADLWATAYGRTLAAKTLAVVIMASLGWLHHLRRRAGAVDPGPRRGLRRPLRAEAVVAVTVVLLATALVGFANPPGEADAVVAHTSGDPLFETLEEQDAVSVAGSSGRFIVGLTLMPPRPGPVDVRVQILGVNPGDGLRDATVQATGPDGRNAGSGLTACGRGCFNGSLRLDEIGTWSFDVEVASNRGDITWSTNVPLPAAAGDELFGEMMTAMERLNSARVREELRVEETDPPVVSDYTLVSGPADRIKWKVTGEIVEQAGIRIGIGTQGYYSGDGGETFEAYEWSGDGFSWPEAFYSSFFADAAAVRDLGMTEFAGEQARVLTFVQPRYPAWYRVLLDPDSKRIKRLQMRAELHLMDQSYGSYNEPLHVAPPPPARITGQRNQE